jgi:hypothetical protein
MRQRGSWLLVAGSACCCCCCDPILLQYCSPAAYCLDPVYAGCGKKADGCPFVAYREAPNWAQLIDCKDVSKCPDYNTLSSSTRFTVPARALDGKISACLTLGANNACPDVAALNLEYPLEVTSATNPSQCGGSVACTYDNTDTTTRTVECRRVRFCCCCCCRCRLRMPASFAFRKCAIQPTAAALHALNSQQQRITNLSKLPRQLKPVLLLLLLLLPAVQRHLPTSPEPRPAGTCCCWRRANHRRLPLPQGNMRPDCSRHGQCRSPCSQRRERWCL